MTIGLAIITSGFTGILVGIGVVLLLRRADRRRS